jgi:hypothetical protein
MMHRFVDRYKGDFKPRARSLLVQVRAAPEPAQLDVGLAQGLSALGFAILRPGGRKMGAAGIEPATSRV